MFGKIFKSFHFSIKLKNQENFYLQKWVNVIKEHINYWKSDTVPKNVKVSQFSELEYLIFNKFKFELTQKSEYRYQQKQLKKHLTLIVLMKTLKQNKRKETCLNI